MDPLSTGLAGIALVQKSVEFIKSNIDTANDISVTKVLSGRVRMLHTLLSTQNWRRNNSAICKLLSTTGLDTERGDKSLLKETGVSVKKKKE